VCSALPATPDRPLLASAGPEAVPSHAPAMTDAPRDAGPKQAAPTRPEKPAADFGYVGIDAILEQMRRKAMKQGFEFNIMVVGEFSRSVLGELFLFFRDDVCPLWSRVGSSSVGSALGSLPSESAHPAPEELA